MKKQKHFSLNNKFKVFVSSASFALVLLAFSAILLPEFAESSFAETTGTGESAVTLTLSPTDTSRSDYYIDFRRYPHGTGSQTEMSGFGVVGINANVVTANEHGYSLYLRSKMPAARMIHSNNAFSAKYYIDTVSNNNVVTNNTGDGFVEMNRYGWSTDWNPNTGAGTFRPMSTTNMNIKTTSAPSPAPGDDTKVYIGAKINDRIMQGVYRGTLSFTAIVNPNRIMGNYTLHYDLNGGNNNGHSFDDQVITVDAQNPSATFTLNTSIPAYPKPNGTSSYTFLGWSTDPEAKTPAFAHNGANTLTPAVFTPYATYTTLYAIWDIPNELPVQTQAPLRSSAPAPTPAPQPEEEKDEEEEETESSKESETEPLGVTTSETDNGTAALIAAGVGTAVAASSFLVLFLAKRKKDEEDELNVEE